MDQPSDADSRASSYSSLALWGHSLRHKLFLGRLRFVCFVRYCEQVGRSTGLDCERLPFDVEDARRAGHDEDTATLLAIEELVDWLESMIRG